MGMGLMLVIVGFGCLIVYLFVSKNKKSPGESANNGMEASDAYSAKIAAFDPSGATPASLGFEDDQ
jgi:hypothetical protein